MKKVSDHVAGYTYGTVGVAKSPVSLTDLASLKVTIGFTEENERYLRLAGEVLEGQTRRIVEQWRMGIIASIPNLARHSRASDGQPMPEYLEKSSLRFEQWILDTCLRPHDQDWLDYQHEIALRHTTIKKNLTDKVQSTPFVPLRDAIAFVPVMNETIKPYLTARGHSDVEVEKMHQAWCKALQLQMALWTGTYMKQVPNEW
jgi:hypothetical protein